jgi:hypothetical protein
MEQKLKFGLVGNSEKKWADYGQRLRPVFSCFCGQKKFEFILKML